LSRKKWPSFDEEAAREDMLTIVIQINGKVRSRLQVSADIQDDILINQALNDQILPSISDQARSEKPLLLRRNLSI